MLFWITAALIALAVAGVLFWPFLRGRDPALPGDAAGAGADLAFYRAQLEGVGRDLARGVIEPPEAERLRTEIGRRILAADRAGHGQLVAGPRALGRVMGAAGLVIVIGGALAAYLWLGRPGYPDLPLQGRIAAAAERLNTLPPQAEAEAGVADIIAEQVIAPPEDIAAIVADLYQRLDAAPDDDTPERLDELNILREFEASVRNFPRAAHLSARLNALLGDDLTADDLLYQADLMLFATGGTMSHETAEVIERAAGMAPDTPGVAYMRGYLLSQVGRPDLAFNLWRPLAEGGERFEPWRGRARLMIETAARAAGVDYALPAEMAERPDVTAEDITAMVEGLAARLAAEGGPPEDWAQLVRALGVLGEDARAAAIWAEAQAVFADDPGLDLINEAAQGAGLVP